MLVSRVVGMHNCKMVESPKLSQFVEERRLGDNHRKDSNGGWSEMEPNEVFPTFKYIQEENGKILHYMEEHSQLNQKMIQNVM